MIEAPAIWRRATPVRLASAYREARNGHETVEGKEETEMIMTRTPAPHREPYPIPCDVHLYDRKGRFIKGNLVGDDYLKVSESNVVFRGALLEKQPFLTWEVATKVRRGATVLSPADLLRMSRLFEEGWDEDAEEESDEDRSQVRFEEVIVGLDERDPHDPRRTAA